MSTEPDQTELDIAKLNRALSILDAEQSAISLTRFEKISYAALNVSVYGWFTFLLLALAGLAISASSTAHLRLALSVFVVSLAISAVLGLLSPLVLVLNVPFIVRLIRRYLRIRALGLVGHVHSLQRDRAARRGLLDWCIRFFAAFGAVIVLIGIAFILYPDSSIEDREATLLLINVWLIAAGFSAIALLLLRRGRRRLKLVKELSALQVDLHGYAREADRASVRAVSFPDRALRRVTEIERIQLHRERQESILSSLKSSKQPQYFVHKSRDVVDASRRLSDRALSSLDAAIGTLMAQPGDLNVDLDARGRTSWRLPGSSVEVDYLVDQNNRIIQLLAVRELDDDAMRGDTR